MVRESPFQSLSTGGGGNECIRWPGTREALLLDNCCEARTNTCKSASTQERKHASTQARKHASTINVEVNRAPKTGQISHSWVCPLAPFTLLLICSQRLTDRLPPPALCLSHCCCCSRCGPCRRYQPQEQPGRHHSGLLRKAAVLAACRLRSAEIARQRAPSPRVCRRSGLCCPGLTGAGAKIDVTMSVNFISTSEV